MFGTITITQLTIKITYYYNYSTYYYDYSTSPTATQYPERWRQRKNEQTTGWGGKKLADNGTLLASCEPLSGFAVGRVIKERTDGLCLGISTITNDTRVCVCVCVCVCVYLCSRLLCSRTIYHIHIYCVVEPYTIYTYTYTHTLCSRTNERTLFGYRYSTTQTVP